MSQALEFRQRSILTVNFNQFGDYDAGGFDILTGCRLANTAESDGVLQQREPPLGYDIVAGPIARSRTGSYEMGSVSLASAQHWGDGGTSIAVVRAPQTIDAVNHPTRQELIALASGIYDLRRARPRFLPESLFGEPVWDILLALYCLPPDKPKLSVSKLCHAVNAPATTTLRWEQIMEQNEIVERSPDPRDGRRFFVSLSLKGEQFLDQILTPMWCKLFRQGSRVGRNG